MKAISVKNLMKCYKEHQAVKGISFEVEEGELFAFLGENGAGKSTSINILCTILEKTDGDVTILGHELGKDDDAIRESVGIVFQNSVLDGKLTVRENLKTRGSYYGLSREQIKEKIDEFWEPFELKEIWNRRYDRLSGGQRRRVDIVRALLNSPKILFLDEPTTGLDPKSRKIVWDYVDYLRHDKGMTIFLTTHYMEEAAAADHVVILDKGEIIADGTVTSLKNKYTSSRLIWYVNETEQNSALIAPYEYEYSGDHYNVFFSGNITEFIYENRNRICEYEISKGKMDDVFLHLKGKEFAE